MDRTEQTVHKTLAAIDTPCYDIGILTDRGMFPRMEGFTASECINCLRYLKYRNANGAHIYFRPSGERRFTLLDDLNQTTMNKLTAEGFESCAVIETSPGNFQAWLKHISRAIPAHLSERPTCAEPQPKPFFGQWANLPRHKHAANPRRGTRFGFSPALIPPCSTCSTWSACRGRSLPDPSLF